MIKGEDIMTQRNNNNDNNITVSGNQVVIIVNDQVVDLNSLLNGCSTREQASEPQHNDKYIGYYYIGKSGFSANYMYEWNGKKIAKSHNYLLWIDKLHLDEYLPEEYPDIDFTQQLRITILFGHKDTMDTHNLGKAIIDQIAEYYGFNDELIVETILIRDSLVDNHYKGYMYVRLENI